MSDNMDTYLCFVFIAVYVLNTNFSQPHEQYDILLNKYHSVFDISPIWFWHIE